MPGRHIFIGHNSYVIYIISATKTALNMFVFDKNITSREKDLLKILKVKLFLELVLLDHL